MNHLHSEMSVRSSVQSGKALKVLVAEDNIINQRLAVGLLNQLGHSGVVVSDGEKALKCLGTLSFDVVLMDVMMPNMDGLEALASIRKREQTTGQHLPVIMATAHTEPSERAKFRQAGADGYLAKPIDINQLRTELGRVLGLR